MRRNQRSSLILVPSVDRSLIQWLFIFLQILLKFGASILSAAIIGLSGALLGEHPIEAFDDEAGPVELEAARDDVTPRRFVHGERANFTGLVLGCIEAKFCK